MAVGLGERNRGADRFRRWHYPVWPPALFPGAVRRKTDWLSGAFHVAENAGGADGVLNNFSRHRRDTR